jgi:hypothetical protein
MLSLSGSKEKKGEDIMKNEEAIGRLTDEEWASKNECGSVERIIEYQTSHGKKRVVVEAKILSGSETRALEVRHTNADKNGDIKLDSDGYITDLVKTTYGLTDSQYKDLCDNKPGDLITKMRSMAMELNGLALDDKETENEKK